MDSKAKILLWIGTLGLIPIALSYGLAPESTLPMLYSIEVSSVGVAHVFRAVMGLYLGMALLWILGATRPRFEFAALSAMAVFMTGLGLGRLLSFATDGIPEPLFVVYFFLEVGFATAAITLARQEN